MYICLRFCVHSAICAETSEWKARWWCQIPGPGVTGGGETGGPGTKLRFSGRKASTLTASLLPSIFPCSPAGLEPPVLLPPHYCMPLSPVKISSTTGALETGKHLSINWRNRTSGLCQSREAPRSELTWDRICAAFLGSTMRTCSKCLRVCCLSFCSARTYFFSMLNTWWGCGENRKEMSFTFVWDITPCTGIQAKGPMTCKHCKPACG